MNLVFLKIFGIFSFVTASSYGSCIYPEAVEKSYTECEHLQVNNISKPVHLYSGEAVFSRDFDDYSTCILESYGFLRDGKFDVLKMENFTDQSVKHRGAATILNNYNYICQEKAQKMSDGINNTAGNFYRCLLKIPNYVEYVGRYMCI